MKTTKLIFGLLALTSLSAMAHPEPRANVRWQDHWGPVPSIPILQLKEIPTGSCVEMGEADESLILVTRSASNSAYCEASLQWNYQQRDSLLLIGTGASQDPVWQREVTRNQVLSYSISYPSAFRCDPPAKNYEKETRERAVQDLLARAKAFRRANQDLICPSR